MSDSMMNYPARQERSRDTKHQILHALHRLLKAGGDIEEIHLRDIAKEANRSTGSIYHHFSSKETMVWILIGELYCDNTTPAVIDELSRERHPELSLRDIAAVLVDKFIRNLESFPEVGRALRFVRARRHLVRPDDASLSAYFSKEDELTFARLCEFEDRCPNPAWRELHAYLLTGIARLVYMQYYLNRNPDQRDQSDGFTDVKFRTMLLDIYVGSMLYSRSEGDVVKSMSSEETVASSTNGSGEYFDPLSAASESEAPDAKHRIQDALLQLLENGMDFVEINVREIVEVSESSMGALYHHFPNKEAILFSLFEDLSLEYTDLAVLEGLDRELHPVLSVREIAAISVNMLIRNAKTYPHVVCAIHSLRERKRSDLPDGERVLEFESRAYALIFERLSYFEERFSNPEWERLHRFLIEVIRQMVFWKYCIVSDEPNTLGSVEDSSFREMLLDIYVGSMLYDPSNPDNSKA